MAQLQAGYFLECINELFNSDEEYRNLQGLIRSLSYFDVEVGFDLEQAKGNLPVDPIMSVAGNLISRGLPTIPSVFLEEEFCRLLGRSEQSQAMAEQGECRYTIRNKKLDRFTFRPSLYKAFHIVDPRVTVKNQMPPAEDYPEQIEETFLLDFMYSIVPAFLGEQFVQLIQRDRSFKGILQLAEHKNGQSYERIIKERHSFANQPADFCVETPYPVAEGKGMVVEIDGEDHEFMTQNEIDKNRDRTILNTNWSPTLRIKTAQMADVSTIIKPLQKFFDQRYFDVITQNFQNPLYLDERGLEALQMALSPLAIARIQKTIIEFIASAKLRLEAKTWRIAVLERDVPCAWLAVDDLKQLFKQLFALEGKGRKLPAIEVTTYISKEFKDCKLNAEVELLKFIEDFNEGEDYDLLIDISVLQRKGLKSVPVKTMAVNVAQVRSCFTQSIDRKFQCAAPIKYLSLFDGSLSAKKHEKIEEVYQYFLNNIFRKQSFEAGQVRLIDNALQLKKTLGVFPQGVDRDLAYEFAVLLQPGVSVVVLPTKAVVYDRIRKLKAIWIDNHVELDANLDTESQIKSNIVRIAKGSVSLAHVSAASFINARSQKLLEELIGKDTYYAYVIVDEAHCISEWGHDFRIAYTTLGRKIETMCKNPNRQVATTLAITGPIRYNVFYDILNELGIAAEDAIYEPLNIGNVDLPNVLHVDYGVLDTGKFSPNLSSLKKLAARKKFNVLSPLLSTMNDYKTKSPGKFGQTIVYCPDSQGHLGVVDNKGQGVADQLKSHLKKISIGSFSGTTKAKNKKIATDSALDQERLASGELDALVGTKAFGIGDPYPNVIQTVHLNMPSSIEEYVQSAGRAGHPSKTSYILYSDTVQKYSNTAYQLDDDGKKKRIEVDGLANLDRYILKSKHQVKYKGFERENSVLNELLHEIIEPSYTEADLLLRSVEMEFGARLVIRPYPEDHPFQLHFELKGEALGFIDLRNLEVQVDNETKYTKSDKVLRFAKQRIVNNCPEYDDKLLWLFEAKGEGVVEGFEKQLASMLDGDSKSIAFSLHNGVVKQISLFLTDYVSAKFTETCIFEILERSCDIDEFLVLLSEVSNIHVAEKKVDLLGTLEGLFVRVREKEDTIRAIRRLEQVGVVADYLVDHQSNQITVVITKQPTGSYTKELVDLLKRYLSDHGANKVLHEVHNFKGETELQKSLNYLLYFVYNPIAQSRWEATRQVEKMCELGVKNPERLRNFVDYYFAAKYAHAEASKSLLADTNVFTKFSFETVKSFVAEVADRREDWMNLKASTQVLLSSYPSNYLLQLLLAYTGFLVGTHTEDEKWEAMSSLMKGIQKLSVETPKFSEFTEQLSWVLDQAYLHKSDLQDMIEHQAQLLVQQNWIASFNSKFLSGYQIEAEV